MQFPDSLFNFFLIGIAGFFAFRFFKFGGLR